MNTLMKFVLGALIIYGLLILLARWLFKVLEDLDVDQ